MARWFTCLAFLACANPGFGQQQFPKAPVPADPLEVATGPVQVVDTPARRSEVWGLFNRARQNHDLHRRGGHPFHLKVSFSSYGNSAYSGNGEIQETWYD